MPKKSWLYDSLTNADTTWNVLAQQIMMARLRSVDNEGNELWPMDIWDGYPFERQELLDHLQTVATPNPAVLTGDIHSNWAADLKQDFNNEASTTIGTEFVCASITSGGDGQDTTECGQALLNNNPQIKFYNAQRDYVTCTLYPEQWRSDYKVLPRVTEADAPTSIRASYITEAGRPSVQET